MKTPKYLLFIILVFFGCGKSEKPMVVDDSKFHVKELESVDAKKVVMPDSWVKEGIVCYGIQIFSPSDSITIGTPIKCKVIDVSERGVKCEALENAPLYENLGCTKMGIKLGETWLETEGDLFPTKEDAVTLLKKRNWYFEL